MSQFEPGTATWQLNSSLKDLEKCYSMTDVDRIHHFIYSATRSIEQAIELIKTENTNDTTN